VRWQVAHFGWDERADRIAAIAGRGAVLAAAFDGPFRGALDLIDAYRPAEKMLTRGLGGLCKPGQSNSPVGRKLNAATNDFVGIVLGLEAISLADGGHPCAVHEKAVVEAFPNAFLGLMIDDWQDLDCARGRRSDSYYVHLAEEGRLDALTASLLPGRRREGDFSEVTNHDDRAALVCALTALGVAAGEFVAVGDLEHGWIMLPPREMIRQANFDRLRANAADRAGEIRVSPAARSPRPAPAARAIEESVPCPL
jgi:hypothetical protein